MLQLIAASLILPLSFSVKADVADAQILKIATWNTYDFGGKFGGVSKASDDTILNAMTAVIKGYDIVFLQEIAQKSGWKCISSETVAAFENLCGADYLGGAEYSCKNIAVIADDTGNCEAYGVAYKTKDIEDIKVEYTGLVGSVQYIPQGSGPGQIIRPPMKTTLFLKNGKQIIVYNIHTRPSRTVEELRTFNTALDTTYTPNYKQNIIALGDFNAGCGYLRGGFLEYNNNRCDYSDVSKKLFPKISEPHRFAWTYIISNNEVTNFAGASWCPYDRIMLARAAAQADMGVCTEQDMDPPWTSQTPVCGLRWATKTSPCIQDTVPGIPSPNKPFGKKFNKVTVTDGKKVLSDHKLVWVKLTFGAISPTDQSGSPQGSFKKSHSANINSEDVFFKGEDFLPNSFVKVYIVPASQIENQNKVNLVPVPGFQPKTFQVNPTGIITENLLINASQLEIGEYTIIVNLDQSGTYQRQVDAQENFSVEAPKNPLKRKLSTAIKNSDGKSNPTRDLNKRRKPSPSQFEIIGSQFPSNIDACIVLVPYTQPKMASVVANVRTDPNGSFTYPISETFINGLQGAYNIFFQPIDASHTSCSTDYNPSIDTLDYGSTLGEEIGFYVSDDASGYNDVVTLGNNALEREVFKVIKDNSIYVLAKNLPPQKPIDFYVLSDKLVREQVPDWNGNWSDPLLNNLDLELVSVPVLSDDSQKRQQTVNVPEDGNVFLPIWINIADKIGQSSATTPNHFITRYGSNFNVVIDINQSGHYQVGEDKVDVHSIGKISSWLSNHDALNNTTQGAEAVAAIKQYQELLNGKLDVKLAITGKFDKATESASITYVCLPSLIKNMSSVLDKDSQIGFKVLLPEQYIQNKQFLSGLYNYAKVNIKNSIVDNLGYSCVNGTDITLQDITVNNDGPSYVNAIDSATIGNLNVGVNSSMNINAPEIKFQGEALIAAQAAINGTAIAGGCMLISGGTAAPLCITTGVAVAFLPGFVLYTQLVK